MWLGGFSWQGLVLWRGRVMWCGSCRVWRGRVVGSGMLGERVDERRKRKSHQHSPRPRANHGTRRCVMSRRACVERGAQSGSRRTRLPDGAAGGEQLRSHLSRAGLPLAGVQVEWGEDGRMSDGCFYRRFKAKKTMGLRATFTDT